MMTQDEYKGYCEWLEICKRRHHAMSVSLDIDVEGEPEETAWVGHVPAHQEWDGSPDGPYWVADAEDWPEIEAALNEEFAAQQEMEAEDHATRRAESGHAQ
jgi:hypothetical protein